MEPSPVPLMSVDELEKLKADAIFARDTYVNAINDISNYRMLIHQYLPITREMIGELDWIKTVWLENSSIPELEQPRFAALTAQLHSLPMSFAFVMAIRNDDCRRMSDSDILGNFFGPDSHEWICWPNAVFGKTAEEKCQIHANYEYMAYVVINEIDELAFNIHSVIQRDV
jgi:hypothetical protein